MAEIGKFLKEKWAENEPLWQRMEAERRKAAEEMEVERKRTAEEQERRRRWEAELPKRAASSERGGKRARTAFHLSLWGLLCLFVEPVALVFALLALKDFANGHDQTGKGKAIAAAIISGVWLSIALAGIVANQLAHLLERP